jgi:hypothetical protein
MSMMWKSPHSRLRTKGYNNHLLELWEVGWAISPDKGVKNYFYYTVLLSADNRGLEVAGMSLISSSSRSIRILTRPWVTI